jgi:hypothetical protein
MEKEEVMNANPLSQRGRALEEMYFRKLEEQNLERRRAYRRHKLSSELQLDDEELLDTLIEEGVTSDSVAALDFAPLLEVVWADGSVDWDEERLILDFAVSSGLDPDGPAVKQLERWLTERPSRVLFDVWCTLATRGLTGKGLEQQARRGWSVSRALAVAGNRTALGIATDIERDVIARIESAIRAGAGLSATIEVGAVA